MRALLPAEADDVDLVSAYAPAPDAAADHPFVRANMISSLDGAIAVGGRSGALGGAADRGVFQVLRSLADVVLVGAGTARAESYGPVVLDESLRAQRAARGQSAVPPIAVVTRSPGLEWSAPFFSAAQARPIVFSTAQGQRDHAGWSRGSEVADMVVAGDASVEPRRVVEQLGAMGHRWVLLEGGPGLNAEFARAGLLDELCLTLSPRLVAGNGPRVFAGDELAPPIETSTVHLLEEDGFLFARLTLSSVTAAP